MQNFLTKQIVLLAAVALVTACSRESDTRAEPESPLAPARVAALAQAEKMTETAYDLKLTGQNGEALKLLEQAGKLLVRVWGAAHRDVASNLDDQATIHLRTGRFLKARTLYLKAKDILKKTDLEQGRLDRSIDRRLHTLNRFEKEQIRCSEPMQPRENADPPSPPYFPDIEQLEPVFNRMATELGGCVAKQKLPVPVRMVITGDGHIVEAHVKGLYNQTAEGSCIEETILQLAPKYAPQLPRFAACYKNITYPFPIGR